MGFYVKNHGEFEGIDLGVRKRNVGTDHVTSGINGTISIFMTLAQKISDGAGGTDDDKEPKISKKTQKAIDALNAQINEKLQEANVASSEELSKAITTSQENQKQFESDIKSIDTEISALNGDIASYNTQINYLEGFLANDPNDTATLNKIEGFKNKIEDAEKKVEELKTKKQELDKQLKDEKINEQTLVVKQAEIENLQYRIDELKKKELPKEVTYNVSKETDDLSSLSDAITKFKNNPSKETAEAVYNARYGGDNGVENATAIRAYEFIVKQYPELFKDLEKSK